MTSTLSGHAHAFRVALESARTELARDLGLSFEHFPRGACGDASILLEAFLTELGYAAECVVGEDDGRSHAWVEVAGTIVDVTADQFGEKPVMVTAGRAWHSRFQEQERHMGRLEREPESSALRDALALVKSKLT